jgi:hypothetical protein
MLEWLAATTGIELSKLVLEQVLNLGKAAEEFDWRGVAKEYVFEVKGIIKANAELRAILAIELAKDIAANTQATAAAVKQMAGLAVEFNLTSYRESILEQYEL